MFKSQKLTKEQALQKAKHYCNYQERCHKEVKDKLYSLGLFKTDVEAVVVQLIEEDYLNEERFAIQFARGKFRMKQWGKNKIVYELKQKQVNTYCINRAIQEIEESEYQLCLQKLAEKKWQSLEMETNMSRQGKIYAHLLQKGYEPNNISKVVAHLQSI